MISTLPRSVRRSVLLLSVLLALLVLACAGPLFAADATAGQPTTAGAPPMSQNAIIAQDLNQLMAYYAQGGKSRGPEWLRTTEIDFRVTDDFKPIFSLATVQPFGKINAHGALWFAQGRYAYQADDRTQTTANLGLGWRKLSTDKHALVGVNTFYDQAFANHHSRLGVGAEYFSRLIEYRANLYLPVSGVKEVERTVLPTGILYTYERALRGVDVEVGSHFKQAPWLGLFASGFAYSNNYHDDLTGYRLRSQLQLTPRLALEAGYIGSNQSHQPYAQLNYTFAGSFVPSWRGANAHLPRVSTDLTYKMLQKVERDNTIQTERFTRFVAFQGNIDAFVTNTGGGPVQGIRVQAYQAGVPVGASAITDIEGHALLTGLTVGDYTVRASYFALMGTTDVTVQHNVTTPAPIMLPIVGGSATVTVETSGGDPIVGADVTVEPILAGFAQGYPGTPASFSITVRTGADGLAYFANLPAGNYQFVVHYNGASMASLLTVVASGETAFAKIILPTSGGNITAFVRDAATDELLNGATVELWDGTTLITQQITGNDGAVTFSGLNSTKSYTVKATYAGASLISDPITPINLRTIAVALALDLRGSITITVNDGTNVLSDAMVSTVVNGSTLTATTDQQGVATISNLKSGVHTVTASLAGYTIDCADVTVAHGQAATKTLSLTRQFGGATITVTDGTTGLSGARVILNGNMLFTDADGKAAFTFNPVGPSIATATKAGYTTNVGSVTITNGGTATATIALTRLTGGATITVTDGTTALSGASVTLNGSMLTTGTDGKATFTGVPTGDYTVNVTKGGYTAATGNVTITNGGMTTATVILSLSPLFSPTTTLTVMPNPVQAGQVYTLQVLITGPVGTPTGTVTFYDGNNQLGNMVLDGTGAATLVATAQTVGTHVVTAYYDGDMVYATSTSAPVTLMVSEVD
ncbi:MAG TPA: carboxypeptidase regulatory-like domain-containing protein [Armatimonadota bacterium]|jgi:hypothetical protein